jgi:hypothetical protein
MKHKGLNLLLSAATVNRRFCTTLLDDPAQALAAGYFGQTFSLTPEERDMVIGIQAQHLEDLAEQIHCWMQFNGNGRNGNGNGRNGHYRQQLAVAQLDPAW